MEKLLIPAATPMALVRLQAIRHLRAEAARRVQRQTAWPRGHAALQGLALVMLGAMSLAGRAVPTGVATTVGLLLVVGIACCAVVIRKRVKLIQAGCEADIANVQNRSLCPLQVLNAKFEPTREALEALQGSFDRAADPTRPAPRGVRG